MSTCPTCKTSYPDTMRLCPTDGTVLEGAQAPKDENIGRTLDGKYRLDKRLSSGGMGTVYKATHLMLGKSLAVKLIKADLPASPDVVRRFQREAKAASALNHPNIAPAYDLGQTQDGTLYIAMEYIDGPNLKEAIQAGPMPPARTINLLKQVASALSLAHKHDIIHRDLKPQNIMLTKDADGREVAKLLDFGIAKTLDDSATQLTATGFSLGTPQYMSPEQAYGRPVDGRSDLYSLGIILYEMLIGEVPFSDPSTPAVLVKQMTEAPVPPALKRPDLQVSPELAAIALKCLEKDPAKRYQTADEFSAALDSAAAALGATVLPLPVQPATAGAAAPTMVIGQPAYAQTTQLPTPAPVPTPSAAAQTTAVSATPAPVPTGPTGATTKISTKPVVAPPAATAPVAAAAEPAKPVAAPAPAPAAAAASAAKAKPSGGAGSRAAVAAVIAILLLGGGAYAAYQMGFLKLGGAKDATATSAATTPPAPATQLATAAPPTAAPAPAATPDPNAAATAAASATSSSAASTGGGASPTSGGGSGTPPSGGASSAAPPAPPAAPPSAPPSNPPSAGTPTMGAAGKTSTHAANTAAAPATVTTTPIKGASGATSSGQPAPSTSSPSTSATSSGATSRPAAQSGAQTPAAAPALPANPSVAFRCDGPPDICGALKSAMDQSLSKDSMPSIRDAARADVTLVGTVTFVDEQTQRMFGQSFTIRNYTIDVNGEAKRGGESVPMPSATTLNYDARYRDRLDEKARLVAASVVENIREFWKKK